MTFTFKKNGTLSTSGQGQQKDGKWKVNAKKSPKELDMTDGNMTTGMIYKLEKDVLTIGTSQPGGGRPKDFASAEVTMVLEAQEEVTASRPWEEDDDEDVSGLDSAGDRRVVAGVRAGAVPQAGPASARIRPT